MRSHFRLAIPFCLLSLLCVGTLLSSACGPRVLIVTGTTIGLKATPGDGQMRPPQVTLAYKRAETALVPTKGAKATKGPPKGSKQPQDTDAYSALASFYFETKWFDSTELRSFIATGHAARPLTNEKENSSFSTAFAAATLNVVPQGIQDRRKQLVQDWDLLDEETSRRILDQSGYPVKSPKTAKESLQDAIKDAQTDIQLQRLESAFHRIR